MRVSASTSLSVVDFRIVTPVKRFVLTCSTIIANRRIESNKYSRIGRKAAKKSPDRREFLKWSAAAAGGLTWLALAWPVLADRENAVRVFGAAKTGNMACTPTMQQADALLVPGGDGYFGRLRLEATAIAYLQNRGKNIYLLDGIEDTEDGERKRQYLQKQYSRLTLGAGSIPDGNIIIEDRSINTASNMAEARKIMEGQTAFVVTNRFHIRAVEFACAYDIEAAPLWAEDLVIRHNPARAGEIFQAYHDADPVKFGWKERLELWLTYWDPQGVIPTFIRNVLPQ